MRVNYIYKKESDPSVFTSTGSTIELKEYIDDLVFYSPLNDINRAEYCLYNKMAKYSTKPEIFTGGPFGSYLKIKDSYSFDLNNFDNLKDTCRISFYLGTNKVYESAKVALRAKDFPEDGLPAGSYSLSVIIDGYPSSTLTLKLKDGSTIADVKNKILFKLNPAIYPFEINIANTEEDVVLLQSLYEGHSIKIEDGLDGTNLLTYFTPEYIEYGSAPKKDTVVFKLFNLSVEHFKNTIKGNDESWLRFKLGNQIIEVPWNTNSINLDNIEINIGDNLIYIFINGKLVKVEMLTEKLTKNEQTLELSGGEDTYSFDELIINSKCIHRKDFNLDTKQLTKYSVKKPYIDFNFAGSEIKDGMELKTAMQSGVYCSLCEDGNFYHWSAGSWRRCTGEFDHSNDFESFSAKLKEFNFSGKDFYIRMFFFSDGVNNSYIDTPYFEMDDETYEDNQGNTSAILIGDKEWTDVLEDLTNKSLIIVTDQGTTEIDFTPTEEDLENRFSDSSYETYMYNVNDVIEKINSYYPDGISQCSKDPDNRVMLISETKGKEAYIMVKGEAAPIIFGKTHYAKGEDANAGTIDYSNFFKAVRTYTSTLLLTESEIPDEQMLLYLKEALNYYKKWRGDPLNQYTCQLKGNWKDGYEIPSVIETQKDIVDIIFKPIFPILFYGSDFIANGAENIFTLTLAQSIFGGRGGMKQASGITQDYYISLMGMQDFKQTLGLNPTWEILNNRIYIYPSQVSRFTNVAIKYKAPLSEEECLKDPDIIKYVHGKCLMTMGNVRGQYGGDLSSGDIALKFNADALYERGKQFVDEVIDLWKKQQPPLGFFFG